MRLVQLRSRSHFANSLRSHLRLSFIQYGKPWKQHRNCSLGSQLEVAQHLLSCYLDPQLTLSMFALLTLRGRPSRKCRHTLRYAWRHLSRCPNHSPGGGLHLLSRVAPNGLQPLAPESQGADRRARRDAVSSRPRGQGALDTTPEWPRRGKIPPQRLAPGSVRFSACAVSRRMVYSTAPRHLTRDLWRLRRLRTVACGRRADVPTPHRLSSGLSRLVGSERAMETNGRTRKLVKRRAATGIVKLGRKFGSATTLQ
jgi:hypothetical protein